MSVRWSAAVSSVVPSPVAPWSRASVMAARCCHARLAAWRTWSTSSTAMWSPSPTTGPMRATLGYPEVLLGVPTIVGAIRMPQKIGWQHAMELLLTGERVDADRAKEMGVVGWVVPHDELLDEAKALAGRLLAGAPLAQRAI